MATIENKMRNDDDCLICFGNVNAKKTHIICDTCKKLYHHHCFRIWICRFKKDKVMACPYCQQDSMLLNTFQTELCACCFPIFFPNKDKVTVTTEKLTLVNPTGPNHAHNYNETNNNDSNNNDSNNNAPHNRLRERAGTI